MTWSGDAHIEPGRLVYRGRLGAAHRHAHAAVQIAAVAEGTMVLTDGAGRRATTSAAVIPAGVEHSVDGDRCSGTMIYLEATSAIGRRATETLADGHRGDVREWVRLGMRMLKHIDPQSISAAADTVIAGLEQADDTRAPCPHPAVRAAVNAVPRLLDGRVRLSEVALAVHLSADRLGRLFAREVGMSFPAYVRWARLIRAMEVARAGGTLTAAAHAAGFSDSAHLNRAFHEMFGLAPTDVRPSVRLTCGPGATGANG